MQECIGALLVVKLQASVFKNDTGIFGWIKRKDAVQKFRVLHVNVRPNVISLPFEILR